MYAEGIHFSGRNSMAKDGTVASYGDMIDSGRVRQEARSWPGVENVRVLRGRPAHILLYTRTL